MKRKIPLLLLAALFLGMACYASSQLLLQMREYQTGAEAYNALTQYVQMPEISSNGGMVSTGTGSSGGSDSLTRKEETVWPVVDFAALQEVNPDVVAWIYLEDTNINYPVVRGADNSEYIDKLVDGTYNGAGSIFMDYRNMPDFTDRHTILYGHHMKNQTMFSQITGYKEQSFYDEHPTVLLLTPEGNYKLEIISGFVTDLKRDAWKLSFASEEEYAVWLENAMKSSTFRSAVTPTPQDRVVTLSTCSYEYDDARYVLLGILIPQ